ncbi:MAG: phthalate transporter [Brevundimonas sp.]|uniref:phthalate transporter n=1 Tax=Brevundimonas sp. TaxID=1871086 RepID=UPI002735CBC8|nr:phthalate transporter [Brevundimonas sp.]MDP3404056.1 phthalate transporter [Brevundimonas sp.]
MARFDSAADLPGQSPVIWRRARGAVLLAVLAGVAWPPLIVTLLVWPPENWLPGPETDWRLTVLLVGILAVPAGLFALQRERDRRGRPGTRLGIVWRFMLYGGLLAAAAQTALALLIALLGMIEAGDFIQGLGAMETTLLIYGVGGLPVAILVGVSYALWAGLCAAYIAFAPAPARVRDRLGVLGDRRPGA